MEEKERENEQNSQQMTLAQKIIHEEVERMVAENSDVDRVVEEKSKQLAGKVPPDALAQAKELVKKALKENASLKEVLGFDDSKIEKFYSYAYHMCKSGNYKEARTAFRVLLAIDEVKSNTIRYAIGYAISNYMLHDYQKAFEAYMLCNVVEPENLVHLLHAADCAVHLNEPYVEEAVLNDLIDQAGDNGEWSSVKAQAEMMLQSCQEQIKNCKEE